MHSDTITLKPCKTIKAAVVAQCKKHIPDCGYRQVSARVVGELLEFRKASIVLRGDTHYGYFIRSKLDKGVYGRGKTPVLALTNCLQRYPYFRNQIIPEGE